MFPITHFAEVSGEFRNCAGLIMALVTVQIYVDSCSDSSLQGENKLIWYRTYLKSHKVFSTRRIS